MPRDAELESVLALLERLRKMRAEVTRQGEALLAVREKLASVRVTLTPVTSVLQREK